MYKFWKKIKKIIVFTLVLFVTINPFVPVIVHAEDGILPTESPTPEALPSSIPETIMNTGDAISVAQTVTEVDSTSTNSQVDAAIIPVTGTTEQVVTPFPLSSPNPEPSIQPANVATESSENVATESSEVTTNSTSVSNQSTTVTSSEAQSSTGGNSQTTSGNATMTSGDAMSIASSISIVNTTMVDSTLQIGIIAILQNWNGDIVIDPPIDQAGLPNIPASLLSSLNINNGLSSVTSIATASASTGSNTQNVGESAEIKTGDAMAIAQNNVVVNTTIIGADLFTLLTENPWLWTGSILNWEYPGSINAPGSLSNINNIAGASCSGSCSTNLNIDNQADVTTTAIATATTGGNTQIASGIANMVTGDAMAGAISTSFVNTTLVNSRYRQLSLLLFAPWSGNLVFAYPDLELFAQAPSSVYEGEDISYTITLKNRGYAKGTNIAFSSTIKGDDQLIYENNETFVSLLPSMSIIRTIKIPTTGLAGQTLHLAALATNGTQEESETNNESILSTSVISRPSTSQIISVTSTSGDTSSSNQSNEVPNLSLSSTTNINNFVYPGDGVTFDMIATNNGPISAKNVVVIQKFFTPNGVEISEFSGKVGELAVSQSKSIRFVMKMGTKLPSGNYYTDSYIHGESDHGVGTESNKVRNPLVVRLKNIAKEIVGSVEAAESLPDEGGSVLGVTAPTSCSECNSMPWYIAITLGSIAYYLMTLKRRDFVHALRWGLTLPFSSYAGLVLSNPSCSKGIIMLSGSTLCAWFLPISYGIYLGTMGTSHIVKNINKMRLPVTESVNGLMKLTD